MQIRQYQTDLKRSIYDQWQQVPNVLAVLPTGGGKTWMFTEIVKEFDGPAVAIAHRQELVSQISLSFAKHGIRHRIIGPENVVRLVNRLHVEETGTSYYHPSASNAVIGVDTLLARADNLKPWARTIKLWVTDEAHHLLQTNKWGRGVDLFPHARGLGVTATPIRADGNGLGRDYDGVFDSLVEGPTMRELISMGFLTDYRIFAPPSDLDLSGVKIGSTGDYSKPGLKTAVRKSCIVGDVVSHYLQIAPGKLGITFAVDVETAGEIADNFNAANVPAAVVSAKTPERERVHLLRKFRSRELLQLVNVDLFGEGFDLPAIEVVSMARPTQSFSLYAQQFGRALRVMDGKEVAIIIDHVGNVQRHSLPDAPRAWTLARRERRKSATPDDVIPVKTCPNCTAVYERIYVSCPYCNHVATPEARTRPEFVDGDLSELDPETLARMRGESVNLEQTAAEYLLESGAEYLPHVPRMSAAKRFTEKQEAQRALRDAIAIWAGHQRAVGRPDSESYRRFWFKFGTDVLSAQSLGRKDAETLTGRILAELPN